MTATIYTSDELHRDARVTEEGFVLMDQQVDTRGERLATDVTGRYWILCLVTVARGRLRFTVGDAAVDAPSNPFAMWVPPFRMIQATLSGVRSRNIGIAGRGPAPRGAPAEPCVFTPSSKLCPETTTELTTFLAGGCNFIQVPRERNPSASALRIKSAIDATYCDATPLQEIAAALRLSPALMTRYFKKAFGITPVAYRRRLRATDATLLLAEGLPVADVAAAVGYNDLGRFYKNFKEISKGTPARYRGLREK